MAGTGDKDEGMVASSAIELVVLLKGTEPEGLGRAEQVAHQLETAIMMGILAQGDRLPSESDLASELGISQLTLRQSLATLRTKGLIETSRGRSGGSVIQGSPELSEAHVRRKLQATSTEDLRDLGDLGTAVASMSAQLAAERADEENIAYLTRLAEQYRDSRDPQTRRRTDGLFHIALGVAAQSSRLTGAMLQIQAELSTLMWAGDGQDHATMRFAQQHADILQAIGHRDGAGAAAAAAAHSRSETELLITRRLELMMRSPEVA
jgi:GntR family transcriptional repressor for pyruvate dehydrogenase complex